MATTQTLEGSSSLGERINTIVSVSAARVAAVWEAAKNRRSVGRLLEWDDRMLRDIGLTSNDVRSALSGSAVEDASTRLGTLSGERRSGLRATNREALEHGLHSVGT